MDKIVSALCWSSAGVLALLLLAAWQSAYAAEISITELRDLDFGQVPPTSGRVAASVPSPDVRVRGAAASAADALTSLPVAPELLALGEWLIAIFC